MSIAGRVQANLMLLLGMFVVATGCGNSQLEADDWRAELAELRAALVAADDADSLAARRCSPGHLRPRRGETVWSGWPRLDC